MSIQDDEIEIEIDVEKVEEASARSHVLAFPRTAPSDVLEKIVDVAGKLGAWIWAILVVLIVVNVVLRYVMRTNYIAMEEMQWHLYAVGFLLAMSFAMLFDGHVRVDVLVERVSLRTRGWVELVGLAVLLLPFIVIVIYWAVPFVERSWRINEVSAAPGGLPYRWIIKSFIITGFILLGIAALARLLRVSAYLFGLPRPRNDI